MSRNLRNALRLTLALFAAGLVIWATQGAMHALSKLADVSASESAYWQYVAENRILDAVGYLATSLSLLLVTAKNSRARTCGLVVLPVALIFLLAPTLRTMDRRHSCSVSNGFWDEQTFTCDQELALPITGWRDA